jgi:hypothetical protein
LYASTFWFRQCSRHPATAKRLRRPGDHLGSPAQTRKDSLQLRYLDLTNTVLRLYKAVLPDPTAREFAAEVSPLQVIADKIPALTRPADISQVMQQVERLVDHSIATEGYVIREPSSPFDADHWLDLSKIDFEKLAEKFKTGRRRTLNEKLKGTVAQKLMLLAQQNRTRMDYLEQFQAMIDANNAEELFQQLVAFDQSLNEEEQRGVDEQSPNHRQSRRYEIMNRSKRIERMNHLKVVIPETYSIDQCADLLFPGSLYTHGLPLHHDQPWKHNTLWPRNVGL